MLNFMGNMLMFGRFMLMFLGFMLMFITLMLISFYPMRMYGALCLSSCLYAYPAAFMLFYRGLC
ncbi:hypothetical protein CUU66_22300 [Peribacillus deserti]|uniref:Uncharacterized protein n=1 Tax=Peribacillus deserti TaxID=673318 RepID=A0A2N5M053_9BACI|nr:hypothetical protein CUU66_22300 [Peribacillus deserti]